MMTRLGLCVGAMLLLWSHLAVAARAVTAENDRAAGIQGAALLTAEMATEMAEMAEEIPEEILRTEIITGARSPLTGEPLSADEYARLQDDLEAPAGGNIASNDIRYLIFLLQVRSAIKPIIPFIP